MKNTDMKAYITRLCAIAKEKSIYGHEFSSLSYYCKALECAHDVTDLLFICRSIFSSDISGNKSYAYDIFKEALLISDSPIRTFLKLSIRRDMIPMVSEFTIKMPDDLFHTLRYQAQDLSETEDLACYFLPFSSYISDPDPNQIISDWQKSA